MRTDIEWEVPISITIEKEGDELIDIVEIYGLSTRQRRSRWSSFAYTQSVVDVEGEFSFETRGGIYEVQVAVTRIDIPSMTLQLSVTKGLGDDDYEDSEEEIFVQRTILEYGQDDNDSWFAEPNQIQNVTEINVTVNYDTKELSMSGKFDGIEWRDLND